MGNVNFHVRIRFEDEVCWIARIKRLNASTPPGSVRDYMISSEAATYKFLNTTTIPAPHLFDFACGAESPTGFGYILMEEVPGVPFSSLSPTLEQSRKVLEQLASVYDELEQHPFELMGSLTNTDDDTDGHIIGPLANELLADISSTGRDLIGPFTSSQAYYEAMIQRILNMIADGQLYPLWAVDAWLIHRFLLDLVPRLKECTPFASAGGDRNEKFFLRHADDKGDHILVDDDFNITGIIDWEWAYTAPRSEAFSSPMAFWDVAGFFDGRNDLSDDEQQLATLLDAVSSARGAAKDGLGRVNACDREDKWESLKEEFASRTNVTIFPNGHLVSRVSDYIIYSVEAETIGRVVAQFGPSTKQGAIVGGQTSCKAPEVAAFEKYLPDDVEIVSCHSLHGPNVDPRGQPLVGDLFVSTLYPWSDQFSSSQVLIKHRASQESFDLVERILSCFNSKLVHLSADAHDRITADTQAVTHAAFLSMGTAWCANSQFPWEIARYVGGIENVKINVTLRIYSSKWHVYAGLAILNPAAKAQIRQYAESVTDLFKLMLGGHREQFEKRVKTAGEAVFGNAEAQDQKQTETKGDNLLLNDEVLDRFSLGKLPQERMPNNHLSLLAIVDCWWKLGISPYDHMICSTPLFRLWLGVTEYLFRKPGLLDEVIRTAIEDDTFRSDDLEFTFAARGWSDCVSFGDFASYRDRFEGIQRFFAPRFPEATRVGNEMIKTILESQREP
ncbi:MAG: prephenate dehydrogenase (NADP(+)) [Caeruleum heppii]|nr:MAG: prephenate dehydrogenase (NADP(+)) [Caeruleum heppii]